MLDSKYIIWTYPRLGKPGVQWEPSSGFGLGERLDRFISLIEESRGYRPIVFACRKEEFETKFKELDAARI